MSDRDLSGSTGRAVARLAAHRGAFAEHGGGRVQADEEFSDFYRRTIRPLVAFLINQGARPHVAPDIAQDTMAKAYRRWADLREPRAWVHKVAARALSRAAAAGAEDLVEQIPEPTALLPCPDAIAEWESRYDMLPVLRSLPARQREVLAWTLAGYKPSDIADHLGVPSETVRGNLAKARRAAAAYLEAREAQQ